MKTKRIIIIVALMLAGLIAFRLFINKKIIDAKNRPAEAGLVRIPVKVAAVQEQSLDMNIIKTGQLAPFREAKALAMTSGTLQQLKFQLGDEVKQGQVLAVTDTRLLQLELQKSETNATKTANDLKTYTELLEGNAATQEKVNEIRQNYQNAANMVAQNRKNIADAAVRAPTSGIITARPVEQGMFVNAGTEIATIVNLSKAKVRVNLTESEVYQVRSGQHVKITADVYPGQVFDGAVSFISPQADDAYNYLTEIFLDNSSPSRLLSGTFVYVDFSAKTGKRALVVPREALTQQGKNTSVYVVKNGIVRQTAIQTGAETGGMIEVVGGLTKGEQVVTSGQINLRDSSAVSISK